MPCLTIILEYIWPNSQTKWKVLDARDPLGTRCKQVEAYIRKEKSHKQLFFVLNKVFIYFILK